MGGDNTCEACCVDLKASCLGTWKECNGNGGYSKTLFSDCCADPGLFAYSLLCPCLLQGQISQEKGRNCCAACVCTTGNFLAYVVPIPPFNFCCLLSTCCYDLPDRMAFGKQNYVEALTPVCCCCNICGRIQLAQELGIKAFDFKTLKAETKASGEHFKQDVMLRNL
jgi:hypothetical protein